MNVEPGAHGVVGEDRGETKDQGDRYVFLGHPQNKMAAEAVLVTLLCVYTHTYGQSPGLAPQVYSVKVRESE